MIPLPEFSLLFWSLMGEILLPTRAEIDMPAPETSYYRLGILIIMWAELTVLARILCHSFTIKVSIANVIIFC
jgi:hypothetical protein